MFHNEPYDSSCFMNFILCLLLSGNKIETLCPCSASRKFFNWLGRFSVRLNIEVPCNHTLFLFSLVSSWFCDFNQLPDNIFSLFNFIFIEWTKVNLYFQTFWSHPLSYSLCTLKRALIFFSLFWVDRLLLV